ncbi:hypothetical protein F5B19DRAFT_434516 [Rostrohypoxylon terebratum]|nr:hypothetical protein F5B19DRAFT_434516 [Rostrohypoxylon terebratum]
MEIYERVQLPLANPSIITDWLPSSTLPLLSIYIEAQSSGNILFRLAPRHGDRLATSSKYCLRLTYIFTMDNLSQVERGTSSTAANARVGSKAPITSPQHGQANEAIQIHPELQEVTDTLRGWDRAAVLQSLSHNLSHHRRFDVLWHRLLLNEQSEITKLEKVLGNLDKRDTVQSNPRLPDPLPNTTNCVPPPCSCPSYESVAYSSGSKDDKEDKTAAHFISQTHMRHHCECNVKNDLLETILIRLKRYSESVLLLHQLQKIPQTSRREWSSLYHTLKGEDILKGSDWDFMSFQDDFLSTRTERADQTFAALVYGNAPLSRLFRWVFKNRNHESTSSEADNKRTIYLHTGGMESLKKGLVAAASGVILMVPVGILLLQPMGKVVSLVVVVCFGAAFVFVLMLLGKTFDTMLFGFSAYSAVLVTFLANTQGGRGCGC